MLHNIYSLSLPYQNLKHINRGEVVGKDRSGKPQHKGKGMGYGGGGP